MEIKRCYETIIGASVGENQLVKTRETSASQTVRGITVTDNRDGSFTLNGTVSGTGNIDIVERIPLSNGHKYAVLIGSNVCFTDSQSYSTTNGNRLLNATSSATRTFNLYVISGDTFTNYLIYPQCIDLTAELGSSIADYIYSLESATAGSGISKLREWGFLRGYQAYNAGSLESVEVTGKKVVGFNQWDEEWELGYYNVADGLPKASSSNIRSKNYIPAIGNTNYYCKIPTGYIAVCEYDGNKNFIKCTQAIANSGFTTTDNTCYLRFHCTSAYGTTYNHDICINLSSDRNGEYEPYTTTSYPLGSDVLRGIFKLDANNNLYADGDRKEADGTITRRYGVVDLGTLNWTMYETNYLYANLPGAKIGLYAQLSNAMCSKYVQSTMSHLFDKTFAVNNGQPRINIYDSAYSDAATFKTAMNGVMLVYELATPTTEQSTPFTYPQIVYPDGTEEFITENGVPVGHETRYEL